MSAYERYQLINFSQEANTYDFESVGPKGKIQKSVHLYPMESENVFLLSFGNLLEDGSLDDLSTNDNRDRNKILATIVYIIDQITERRPELILFFNGSTPARTRLYRMAISLNYAELSRKYMIRGFTEEGKLEVFRLQVSYISFLIHRK
ncbi:MAG: hypothetical protein P0Y53_11395 [Candidatus Pseudobacter hemicellulosilyticus]|uniref:Uncharacterized protein n=1 Tax=Candidatus Pseudobacter hemicellulosilyticus TaxID=3121375 RepID=A0AAJ5WYW5_9BACT|nr:MAG: hypothetical protein P0Y53_11395 [Pseudobacter sp.]